MLRSILFVGTASDVGKSFNAAGATGCYAQGQPRLLGNKLVLMPGAFNVAGFAQSVSATGTPRTAAVTQGSPDLKNENNVTYFARRAQDRITTRVTNPVGEATPEGYLVRTRTTHVNANEERGCRW